MPLDSDLTTDVLAMGATGSHTSPLFDFITAFAPRKLKDLFRLTEYLYYNSAQIYAAIQKFAIYPITEITYVSSTNEMLKERYKKIHEKTVKTKKTLSQASVDKWVYGNSFISVFTPFVRFLKCPACSHLTNIQTVEYEFKLKRLSFTYACSNCQKSVNGTVIDRKLSRPDKINIIRWDPKLMDIDYNPISSHSQYFYTIPKELKERVNKGNKHLINNLPMEFLKAIRDDKLFEFSEDQLFHMKMDAPAGIEAQWGFPPLTATIKLFFFAAILRKANESVCLDYAVPMRIISPAQTTSTDPVNIISLGRWVDEMKTSVKKWRRDPLHIMWSPIKPEITQMGGNARALLTLGEVQEAEGNIIAAMGIPKEFLYGGLNYTGSAVTLRMLENQLIAHTADLNDLLQWLTDKFAKILGWPKVEVELAKFKLIDDVEQKRLILALNQNPEKPVISDETLADLFGYDLAEERRKRKQNMLDEVRFSQELQQDIQQLQNTLAQQIQSQMAQGAAGGMQYDQQQVIANADNIVQQFMQLDPGVRRSQLHSLQTEDFVLYSVVVQRMEEAEKGQQVEALQAVRSGGMPGTANTTGGPPMGGAGPGGGGSAGPNGAK